MIFGFLFMELVVITIAIMGTLILVGCDSEWWAAFFLSVVACFYVSKFGQSDVITQMSWVEIATSVAKAIAIYVVAGLVFSLFKWKLLTAKAARSLKRWLEFANIESNVEAAKSAVSAAVDGAPLKKFVKYDENHATRALAVMQSDVGRRDALVYAWSVNRAFSSDYYNPFHRILSVDSTDGVMRTDFHVGRLTTHVISWTIYWPFHAALILFGDVIARLAEWFVEYFGSMFQRISDSSFQSIK